MPQPNSAQQVVAAIGPRAAASLDRRSSRDRERQLLAAPIDAAAFSVGRRLEANQRLDGVEQPIALGAAEIAEMVYSGHVDARARPRGNTGRAGSAAAGAAAVPAPGTAAERHSRRRRPLVRPKLKPRRLKRCSAFRSTREPSSSRRYDAGRGQRYYIFGSAASFVELVAYRT